MGKAGRYNSQYSKQQWDKEQWDGSPSSSWSLWSGARRYWDSHKPKNHRTQFPSYDSNWEDLDSQHIAVVAETRYDYTTTPGRAAEAQRVVNIVRKAETKLAKLRKDMQAKAAKWTTYQREMKAAYNREQDKHEKHMQWFHTEIEAAQAAQEEAYQLLEQVPARIATNSERGEHMEIDDAWDELMETDRRASVQQIEADIEELLERRSRLRGRLGGPQRAEPPGDPGPTGPPGLARVRPAQAAHAPAPSAAMNPTSYNAASPSTKAPYVKQGDSVTSPEHHGPTTAEPDDPDGPPKRPRRPAPEGRLPQRKPVTALPKAVPRSPQAVPSLGDKLDAKRVALAASRAAAMEAGLHPSAGPPGPPVPPEATQIIQDDEDADVLDADNAEMQKME